MGRAIPLLGLLIIFTGCRSKGAIGVSEADSSVVWIAYTESDIPLYPEVALLKVYISSLRSPVPELSSFADSMLDSFPVSRVLNWVEQEVFVEKSISALVVEGGSGQTSGQYF